MVTIFIMVPLSREANLYQGVRITLCARPGAARIALQVDIGFGDAVFPAPEEVEYPSLLGFPCPTVPHSIRIQPSLWGSVKVLAKTLGISTNAAFQIAVSEWAERRKAG